MPSLKRMFSVLHGCLVVLLLLCTPALLINPAFADTDNKELRIAMLAAEARFDTNTMVLTDAGEAAMQRLFAQLDQYHDILSIRIVGHTDNVGSSEQNLVLSKRRAESIKQSFAKRFNKVRLIAIGAGESQPIVNNDTEGGRKQNRRVEIQVIARGYIPSVNNAATTNN